MNMMHLSSVDLNLLVVFEAVYSEKNLTRAGEKLGLTQSAVSHALARVRKLLGDPLFVRSGGGMVPTPRAEEVYAGLAGPLGGIRRALEQPRPFVPEEEERTFLLSMSDYCGMVILPPLTARLRKVAPGIGIAVSPLSSDRTQEGLETGAFELVVGNRKVGPGIFQRRLFVDEFVCMVRKGHPEVKSGLSLEGYLRLHHGVFDSGGKADRLVREALEKEGVKRKVALKVPHILVIPRILESTDLIVTLPRRLALSFSPAGEFRLFSPPVPIPPLEILLYWHEKYNNDPAIRWLRETACAVLEEFG